MPRCGGMASISITPWRAAKWPRFLLPPGLRIATDAAVIFETRSRSRDTPPRAARLTRGCLSVLFAPRGDYARTDRGVIATETINEERGAAHALIARTNLVPARSSTAHPPAGLYLFEVDRSRWLGPSGASSQLFSLSPRPTYSLLTRSCPSSA